MKKYEAVDYVFQFITITAGVLLATKRTTVNELRLNLNLSDLSSTAWLTAARTGALGHMPHEEVQRYSRLYDLQDLVDLEAFRYGVMELRSALKIHEQMARRLSDRYAEALK